MADNDETGGFDRLAGEPEDPTAGTRELVASTGARDDTSMELGDVSLTDISQPEAVPPAKTSPVPWIVVGLLALTLVILVVGFLLPAQSSIREAQAELEAAREELLQLRDQVGRLTSERDEAIEARTALEAETEARANELEQMARESEAQDAADRKAVAAEKSKRKKRKKRRRR